MIIKSVLTIRFGLAKNKLRQAEANMFYPVCTIIALKQMLFSVAKATLQPQMSASLSVHSEAKSHHTYKPSCLSAIIPISNHSYAHYLLELEFLKSLSKLFRIWISQEYDMAMTMI